MQVAFDAGISIAEISAACEGLMARASNGDVYQWGNFFGNWQMSFARPTKVPGVSGATSIERGCSTSFAVLTNGTAMAWGSNGGGRLGDGTTTDRPNPVAVSLPAGKSIKEISTSSSHALAIATDNTVFGWGGNSNGQLAVDPNALSFSSTPRAIAIGSTTARAVAAADSTPFSTVVTNANSVLRWGGWGTNEFVPTAMSLPTADLGNRTIKDIETFQGATILVADDESLWGKGWWSSADIDGNCGANASDWPMWKDGITTPARPFVRTISQDQFGPAFNEDSISIARLETGSGAVLPLDGSGSAIASVSSELVLTATSPRSTCYSVDQLVYEFSDDNGSTWSRTGITTSVNGFAQTVVNVSYTPTTSGRKRAQLRILNPDGKFAVYRMSIGVAASSGGGGSVAPSALPIVAEAEGIAVAIGTDKLLYAWGSSSSITGSANEVKEPVRVTPAVDVNQTFRSVSVFRRSAGSYVGAAVSEDGKLYVWGNGSTDLFLGGQTDVVAPTQMNMPSGKIALSATLGSSSICSQSGCVSAVFGLVTDSQGSVYGWGGGPESASCCVGARFGGTVIPIPSLAGIAFESIVPTWNNSGFLLRQSSGDLYYWNSERSQCQQTCTWRTPVFLTTISSNFATGNSFQIGNSGSAGVLQITSNNVLQFVPIGWDGQTVGSPVSLSLPGSRTAAKVAKSGYGFRVLASDGTLWSISGSRWPAWKVNIPVDALPVNRFASQSGGFIIGSGGSLWGLSSYDSSASGTCSEVDYDRSSAARTTSVGQFGPAFRADSFSVALDSPRYTNYNDVKSPRVVESPQYFTWGTRQLDLRPNASTRLYTYFKSSCTGTTGLSVEWDLNDDGEFETAGVVSSVTSDTTSLTTPIVGNPNYEGDGDWLGISQTDFLESSVNITSSSPLGSLNQGGGRFIAVKYSSSAGSSIQRFALIVKPKKPEGRVGVTINQGARFTDNAEVTLGLVWPEGTTTAVISNDGSFSDAQQVPIASSIRWSLPSNGSGLLSSTVYVRFESLWPNNDGGWASADEQQITNLTDDIVLDLSPPEVSSVSASSDSNAQSQSFGIARSMSTGSKALVSFSALDAVSGVSAVQITSDPAVPGPERALSSQYVVPVDRGTIAVRAKDNVGHWSRWSYARVSSFVPQPEIPAAPATPSAPAVPAAPSAPATPSAPAAPAVPEVAAPAAPGVTVTPATPAAPAAATPSVSASVKLSGTTARVSVSIPSTLAKTCATKVVKGKKTSVCTPATIAVSVSGGGSKTVKAKAGSNAITIPKAKKGATVTIRVNGKVVQRIKM